MSRQILRPAFRQALPVAPVPVPAGLPRLGFALLCDRLLNGGVSIAVNNDAEAELARAAEAVGFVADPNGMCRLLAAERDWAAVFAEILAAVACVGAAVAVAIVGGWRESDPPPPPMLRTLPTPVFRPSGDI